MNPFNQLLRAHGAKSPIGTWLLSASPIVAEAVGSAGFDWGVLDMEHAPVDLMELVQLLQAVGNTKMVPVVRLPWNDTVTVKRVLDAGALTLLFPMVQNADEARRARGGAGTGQRRRHGPRAHAGRGHTHRRWGLEEEALALSAGCRPGRGT